MLARRASRSRSTSATASFARRVHDDGHGFDPASPDDGFGLTGMRERVALLRGELEITSSPDGTTIAAAIPTP